MSENNVTGIIGATVGIGQYIINDYVIIIAPIEGDYGYTMTITRGSETQTVTLKGLSTEQYDSMVGYMEQAQTASAAAETAQEGAEDARDAAQAALNQAITYANNAAASATAASTSADNASNSEYNAAQSLYRSIDARDRAEAAKTAAQSAQTTAEAAATNAGNAQTAAEAAQTAAETARAAAETAESNAQTYAGQASQSAANAGQSAASAAQTLTQVQAEGAAQIAAVDAEGQRVLASIPADYSQMEADVTDLKSQMPNKYDRYRVDAVSGLSVDMFSVFPTQYSIVQYDSKDGLQHSTLSGSGITNLVLLFKPDYTDFTFKLHYGAFGASPSVRLVLANNAEYGALALSVNLTSNNINRYTATTTTVAPGISRNENCPSVAANDTMHYVRKGTKIALYLVNNGVDVPLFGSEFVDIVASYGTYYTESDICFGLCTTNSARNEVLLYDFTQDIATGDHFMSYNECDDRLTALENGDVAPNTVDLFLFMGQSNMAGRGTANRAPEVIEGAGYEFRAISDPTKLYPITDPFGLDENVQEAIYDYLGGYKAKTGDMIPAFVNAYYSETRCPIVGVSASEGGISIANWLPSTARYLDAKDRFDDAVAFLTTNGYAIRHKYLMWCQGETNGDMGTSKADYIAMFTTLADAWFANGVEKIFVVKIGNYNGQSGYDYSTIMTAQNEICQTLQNVIMVSTDFAGMKARDLMRDDFHYKQAAYNEVGEYAGINTAFYVKTGKEPTMYDTQDGSLYYTHKN